MDGVGDRNGDDATWSWRGCDPVAPDAYRRAGVVRRPGPGRRRQLADGRDEDRPRPRAPGTASTSGHTYGMRVRARDRAGNIGPWTAEMRSGCPDPVRTRRFVAVNLIIDPIHGYIELTKRLTRAESAAAGPPRRGRRRAGPARHRLAPAAAPHQPAAERPLGLPDRRAFAVHPRARGHARGRRCGRARSTRASATSWPRPASPSRPRGWSSRPCGSPACSTTSGTGRSPTSSTSTCSRRSRRRPTRAGRAASA